MTIGQLIRKIRDSLGLTQSDFAEAISQLDEHYFTSTSSVSNWENDKQVPHKRILAAIAKLGKIDVTEFYSHPQPIKYPSISRLKQETALSQEAIQPGLNLFVKREITKKLIDSAQNEATVCQLSFGIEGDHGKVYNKFDNYDLVYPKASKVSVTNAVALAAVALRNLGYTVDTFTKDGEVCINIDWSEPSED